MTDGDHGAIARAIIDGSQYLTLATADAQGRPWASPVYYAAAGYTAFYWASAPGAAHSQNIAQRPEVGIVIFDSRVPAGAGQAVYMAATARQLSGRDLRQGLESYPGQAERGGGTMTAAELEAPAPYRLYLATVSQHWILCPRDTGPCAAHGHAFDHRIPVSL